MNKIYCHRELVMVLLFFWIWMGSYVSQFPRAGAQVNSCYYMPQGAPIYWSGPSNKQAVALTFDDGPDSIYTPQILEVLAKYKVKATFFVVGARARLNPALVEKILAEGHEIGSHSMTHPDSNSSPAQQLQNEVLDSVTLLQSISNQKIKYFRPPYGELSPAYFAACYNQGLTMIFWSIDSNDWRLPPVNQLVEQVASQVQPGSIILFHDGGGVRQNTVAALAKLLPLLKQMQLKPVTLSQMYE